MHVVSSPVYLYELDTAQRHNGVLYSLVEHYESPDMILNPISKRIASLTACSRELVEICCDVEHPKTFRAPRADSTLGRTL